MKTVPLFDGGMPVCPYFEQHCGVCTADSVMLIVLQVRSRKQEHSRIYCELSVLCLHLHPICLHWTSGAYMQFCNNV